MVARTDLNGYYKTRYGGKAKLVPEWAHIQQRIPFKQRAKIGKEYQEVVFLRRSHGITFAGTATAGTVYDLQDAISLKSEEAKLSGTEMVMREQIAYGTIAAAQAAGEEAYGAAMDEIVLGLEESHRFYLEAGALYGGTSIAEIESVSGSGTSRTWTITKKSWAPGIWAQGEGAKIDAYDNPGGTKRNTNAAVIVAGSGDPDARQIAVTGDGTDLTAIVAGDKLVFYLADGQLFSGLDKVLTHTSGVLHNINATTYGLWRGNQHSAADSPLTMGILHAATVKGVVRGLMGKFCWYVNTYSWQNLVDNENALRRYAEKQNREYVQGAESIAFVGANGAKMEILAHPVVKAGEAFGISEEDWVRGGESDITDRLPGADNEDFFHEIPGKAGVEIRNFSSQFLFCRKPARQVKITNIVPTGLA